MRAYKCDRCGRFYIRSYKDPIIVTIDNHPYGSWEFEFCDQCNNELSKWFTEKEECSSMLSNLTQKRAKTLITLEENK